MTTMHNSIWHKRMRLILLSTGVPEDAIAKVVDIIANAADDARIGTWRYAQAHYERRLHEAARIKRERAKRRKMRLKWRAQQARGLNGCPLPCSELDRLYLRGARDLTRSNWGLEYRPMTRDDYLDLSDLPLSGPKGFLP